MTASFLLIGLGNPGAKYAGNRHNIGFMAIDRIAAGHNGLKSLDAHLGPDYWRVRLGIGHPGERELVTPYVLSDFMKVEQPAVEGLLAAVAKELPLLLAGDAAGFMNRLSLVGK